MFIGIDIGTSGCRAVAVDDQGVVRGEARAYLPAPRADGPESDQQPQCWWVSVGQALYALLQRVPAESAKAICVAGTSGTVLLTDGTGTPLGPGLMYNDARSRAEAEEITRIAPAESGAHGPTSGLAKLLHLLGPGRHTAARYVSTQASWVAGKLCGEFDICDENNALKLGFDSLNRQWPEWLATLRVPIHLLPKVAAPGQPIGTVTAAVQQRFGFSAATRVVAGTTDSVAGFIATGAHAPGDAVTSLGSTLVLKIVSAAPIFVAEKGIYSHRLGDLWLAGGASNTGGRVLLDHFSQKELDRLTPHLRPERPTGLDYYPLATPGERFPIADPELAPRLTPRPADDVEFLQAMLEGIARIEHKGYAELVRCGSPPLVSVRTVGGGAANHAWTAIRARLLGVPMLTPAHSEAAYGAARLAAGEAASKPQ